MSKNSFHIANRIFIIIQLVMLGVDIILSFVCDIGVYFMTMWFCGLILVLYSGITGTIYEHRVIFKDKNYIRVIKKYPYVFTDLRILHLARKIKDTDVIKHIRQRELSIAIFLINILYVIIYTIIVHPENIA